MTDLPRPTSGYVINEVISVEQAVADLHQRGVFVSERSLREQARRMGCYRKIGRAMFFLPQDLERLMTPAPKAKQLPSTSQLGKRSLQHAAKTACSPLPKLATSKPRLSPTYRPIPYTREMVLASEEDDKAE